ncbi:MAG: bifunctional biotin--[acetyl-CoA-carboxylase] ligase/biotin operon repressor BirA [Cellvibrio sp.]|nr:bifunctional biotin--[acetyl-CoA-carboxylase] ligase/biotin operon repressor BirA [Cellvibrio sp.]
MSAFDSVEWTRITDLIDLLSDGECHSGEQLGLSLAISRAGVWKYIKKIEQLGVCIESIKGKGYKLKNGLHLLDLKKIGGLLTPLAKDNIAALDLFSIINSTNTYLLNQKNIRGKVCLAELQTEGRGRRGRQWVSPFGRNIYLSIGWSFESGVSAAQGLSLAVGVAIVEVLNQYQINGLYLKWPNDVVIKNSESDEYKKLAGILIELRGDVSGDCDLIIGVGLNFEMEIAHGIDQPWISLSQVSEHKLPDRNTVVAELISKIIQLLVGYERHTFAHYRESWGAVNIHMHKRISTLQGKELIEGVCCGVTDEGALILLKDSGETLIVSGGEISIRGLS